MAFPGAVPASMGKRLLAFVVDVVAATVVGGSFVVAGLLPLVETMASPETSDAQEPSSLVLVGSVLLLAFALFQWWYLGARGFTVGKRIVGLRVLSPGTGQPVGMGRAVLRLLVPAAGSLLPGVGPALVYASPFLDSSGRRQGWHDKAAGSMVFDTAIGLDPATASRLSAPDVARRMDALLRVRAEGGADEQPTLEPALRPAAPAGPTDLLPDPPGAGRNGGDRAAANRGLDAEVEQTRLRPARSKVPQMESPVPKATIEMSDGRRVILDRTALIGRKPAPRPDDAEVQLIEVPDPGRSVSKTHLAIGVDRSGVWVRDRDSTNGTVVTLADGQQILCAAEQQVRLPAGASVAFGDYGLRVS